MLYKEIGKQLLELEVDLTKFNIDIDKIFREICDAIKRDAAENKYYGSESADIYYETMFKSLVSSGYLITRRERNINTILSD